MVCKIIIFSTYHLSIIIDHHLRSQPSLEPALLIVNELLRWHVNSVFHSRPCYRNLQYLSSWAEYNYIFTYCMPAEHIRNTQDLVDNLSPRSLWTALAIEVHGSQCRYGGSIHILECSVVLCFFIHFASHLNRFSPCMYVTTTYVMFPAPQP